VALLRWDGPDEFVVVANPGDTAVALELDLPGPSVEPVLVDLPGWSADAERSATWPAAGRLAVRVGARRALIVRLVGRSR
jgi:hypothetical protein